METLLQTIGRRDFCCIQQFFQNCKIGVIIIYAFGMLIIVAVGTTARHRAEIRSMRKNGYDPDRRK
jgi:hypothetical protein